MAPRVRYALMEENALSGSVAHIYHDKLYKSKEEAKSACKLLNKGAYITFSVYRIEKVKNE